MGGTAAPEYYNGSSWCNIYHTGNNGNILQKDSQAYYRASTWLEFYNTTSGLYWNSGTANGWMINPQTNWYTTFRSGNSGSSGIDFRTSDNTQRGYVYADNSNNLGFLDPGGSWAFNTNRAVSYTHLTLPTSDLV